MNNPKEILLIAPTSNKERAEVKWLLPPLGIVRLAGFLNANNHNAEFFDLNLHKVSGKGPSLEDKLKERQWDIIGFSVLEDSLVNDISNMYLAKKLSPDAMLIAGGIEAQFNYQTILDKTPCNTVILGEGEIPLLKIANEENLDKISGIVFRRDAKPLTSEQFWDITNTIDWENIPFEEYWDFYLEKYKDELTEERLDQIYTLRIFTRNRCPSKCNFCASTNQLSSASGYEVPIIDIMAEQDITNLIRRIKESHPKLRTIYFTDDDFCMNPKKVIEFCKNVIDKDIDLKYICFSRVNELRENMLKWMEKAGFRALNIGVESFSQNILDEFNKRCDSSTIEEKLELVKKYNIKPFISIILTSPNCTLDDIEYTAQKLKPLVSEKIVESGITLAGIPFKGTQLYEETFDYMTEIIQIQGTKHNIKKDYMVLANDPYVREVQLNFYYGVTKEIETFKKETGISHITSANQALIRLEFLEKIIYDIRETYNIKKGERGDPELGKLTAAIASKGTGDRYQGL